MTSTQSEPSDAKVGNWSRRALLRRTAAGGTALTLGARRDYLCKLFYRKSDELDERVYKRVFEPVEQQRGHFPELGYWYS